MAYSSVAGPFRHRITIANIATCCRFLDLDFTLAIQNDNARKRGATAYGALGGGAIITDAGIAELQALGDIQFEDHIPPTGYDARMVLTAQTPEALNHLHMEVIQTVLTWARTGNTTMIELDIARELREELVDDAPGIISRADLATIQHRLVGWMRGTVRRSSRGPAEIYTTPFYLCHHLDLEDPVTLSNTINRDPLKRVRIIGDGELSTTANGTCEGRTADGHILFSNVFPHELVRPL